jgi:hypothetical protein
MQGLNNLYLKPKEELYQSQQGTVITLHKRRQLYSNTKQVLLGHSYLISQK